MRRKREDRGASAVEFALILIPLLVVIFGLVQYGLYFYSAQTGSHTVNAAIRQLSVGNCQNSTQLQNYIQNQLGAATTDTPTVTQVWKKVDGTTATGPTDTNVIGGTVTLTVTFHSMNMHFPFVPFLSDPRIDRQVTARVEDTTDQGCPA